MDNIRETLSAKGRARWKAEQRRRRISLFFRWGIGVPLLLFCFPIIWFGPFLMLLGAILISPELADCLAGPFGSILWSHREVDPRPLYDIPESLVARGKYVEAEKEYEKIVEEFPSEVKPHVDLINIAVMRLGDTELADQLYQQGMDKLKDSASKETLTRMYKAILTRLKDR